MDSKSIVKAEGTLRIIQRADGSRRLWLINEEFDLRTVGDLVNSSGVKISDVVGKKVTITIKES